MALVLGWNDGNNVSKLKGYRLHRAIRQLPSPFWTLSFMCAMPFGPVYFDFNDYRDFIHRAGAYKHEKGTPRLGRVLGYTLVGVVLMYMHPFILLLVKAGDFRDTDGPSLYDQRTLSWKIMMIVLLRAKHNVLYIGFFKLAEAGLIACGLGYNHERRCWGRFAPLPFKRWATEPYSRTVITWNSGTSSLLRYSIYGQVSKPWALTATMAVSAAMHGINAASIIYFAFIVCLRVRISRGMTKLRKHTPGRTGMMIGAVQHAVESCDMTVDGMVFHLQDVGQALHVWSGVYYINLVTLVVGLVLVEAVIPHVFKETSSIAIDKGDSLKSLGPTQRTTVPPQPTANQVSGATDRQKTEQLRKRQVRSVS